MKTSKLIFLLVLVLAVIIPLGLATAAPPDGTGPPTEEGEGNNLSFPVIWAEDYAKTLRPPAPEPDEDGVLTGGAWYFWWGTEGSDPDIVPLSCLGHPTDKTLCANGSSPPLDDPDLVRAYVQKDALNQWQATNVNWSLIAPEGVPELYVHEIDWGDNLESVDWYTRSQVRTEVVLYQNLLDYDLPDSEDFVEYEMRHVAGWGIDEVHGLAAALDETPLTVVPAPRGTVYSHCARLTIQQLLVSRDDPLNPGQPNPVLENLVWVPEQGWTEAEGYEENLSHPPIFNLPVHDGGDGPGYYSAEINVKGRVIYGYTWNVRKLENLYSEDKAGDYRLTFSFDEVCGAYTLNTFFGPETTIIVPIEEEVTTSAVAEEPGGGGSAVLVPVAFDDETGKIIAGTNLTYMDISILERSGGGGGGGRGEKRR